MSMHAPYFDGPHDDASRADRLTQQHEVIRRVMADGTWRTLGELERLTGYPQASISAQLRHLRKRRFGSYRIEKTHLSRGLWQYRLLPPEDLFAALEVRHV